MWLRPCPRCRQRCSRKLSKMRRMREGLLRFLLGQNAARAARTAFNATSVSCAFPVMRFLRWCPKCGCLRQNLSSCRWPRDLNTGLCLHWAMSCAAAILLERVQGFRCAVLSTTPERLVAFSGQLGGARSAKLARSAALQVRRKSASIMETEVAIAALTSRRRGGLGLPPARLNEPFALGEKGQRIAHQKSVVGDICWWDKGAVVEYDGRESHGSREAQIRDSRRRDALLAEGIDVTTITSSQFANVCEFSTLMGEVSQKAGKVFRGWRPGQIEKHMKLRQDVRSFHRDYPSRR